MCFGETFIKIGHVFLEISAKEVTAFGTQRQVGVILLGSFLISDPHIDKECFVAFVFSVCCIDLEINRNRTSPCGM